MPAAQDTNGDSVAIPMLSELFTPTSTFQLGSVEIVAGGGNASNNQMNMRLYTLSSSGGTGFPTGNGGASGDNFYFPGTELLGTSGAGLFFNFPGFSGQQLMEFDLSNGANSNDQVTLTAGTTYALEFWQPSSPPANLMVWSRDGAPTLSTGGQMMGSKDETDFSHSRSSLATLGGAPGPRVGSLALIAAPEPGSLALIALGALGMVRRRKA
jgi:hypothetical protein